MTAAYPPELLSASIDAKYEYFRGCLVQHHHLKRALEELMLEIELPTDELLTLVVGTTGVGKTMLRNWAASELTQRLNIEKEPSRVAVVSVEAVGSDNRGFSMRDLLDQRGCRFGHSDVEQDNCRLSTGRRVSPGRQEPTVQSLASR